VKQGRAFAGAAPDLDMAVTAVAVAEALNRL